ncbi:MAG: T9SS type A sorting domain-containing protein [Chitinophagaceae bacterium]
MKTFVPSTNSLINTAVVAVALFSNSLFAQSGNGGGNSGTGNGNGGPNGNAGTGLSFDKNPSLMTGSTTDLKQGAVYFYQDVMADIDATVRIDSLVNGAKVTQIDDNSNGLGYKEAFQPEVRTGNVIAGKSYAVFTIKFFKANTTTNASTPVSLQSVNVTALDIDGNVNLKEFAEINMGSGGTAKYMSTTNDLSLLQILTGRFVAQNILGIERTGIDTAALANMYTASNGAVSSITFKYGALTVLPEQTARQFSLYMKGFTYPNQITLPIELVSFDAVLNNNKVDLKWVTATEKNVDHFAVEKSLDGVNYSDAGIVFAYGNTTEEKKYSFSDTKINTSTSGVIYYRLHSIDMDGKSQYSPIRMIRISKDQAINVVTYPNPVTNELRVTIPQTWQGKKVSYEIFNTNGRVINRTESGSSSQTEAINASSFSPGVYVVKVTCNGETATQKIVKK